MAHALTDAVARAGDGTLQFHGHPISTSCEHHFRSLGRDGIDLHQKHASIIRLCRNAVLVLHLSYKGSPGHCFQALVHRVDYCEVGADARTMAGRIPSRFGAVAPSATLARIERRHVYLQHRRQGQGRKRVASLAPGVVFGEMATRLRYVNLELQEASA